MESSLFPRLHEALDGLMADTHKTLAAFCAYLITGHFVPIRFTWTDAVFFITAAVLDALIWILFAMDLPKKSPRKR